MKNLAIILILSLSFLASCANYGSEKKYGNLQMFYTEGISESQVDELATFLEEQGFVSDTEISVQLNKEGEIYQFRMVTKDEFIEDETKHPIFKTMANMISSEVFDDATVEVHLCDERLETMKIIKQ
ncbi:MAG: hypothetical protein ACI9N1_002883 [Flavobacteriales bacterium]|jgi:hypothetical protein